MHEEIKWPDLELMFSVIPRCHGSPTLMTHTHTQRLRNVIMEKGRSLSHEM